MNEIDLAATWAGLDPNPSERQRIDARVRRWLEATESSMATEWFGLIRISPIAGFSFAALAASLVVLSTPLGWVVFSML